MSDRRGWFGHAFAAFAGGFAAAALAASGYLTLGSANGSEVRVVPETAQQMPERNGGRGEIAIAQRTMADRLAAARVPTTRLRGGMSIRLSNVNWADGPRRPFLRATAVRGVLDFEAVERGDIVVDDVVFTRADVLLEQPSPGSDWNYERVLADLLDGDDDGNGNGGNGIERGTVLFRNVTFVDSRVEVHEPSNDLIFEDLDANASRVELESPRIADPEIDLTRLSTNFSDVRRRGQFPVTLANARLVLPDDRVDFRIAGATWGATRLASLEGRWEPGAPGSGITIGGRATDAQLIDLEYFTDRLPRTGGGSFTFAVRSLGEAYEIRLAEMDVRTEGSRLRGAIAMRAGGEHFEVLSVDSRLDPLSLAFAERLAGSDLPYGGTLTGTVRGTGGSLVFALNAQLTADQLTQPFAVRLDGAAALVRGDFNLQRLQATLNDVPAEALRPLVSGLPFRGNINGTISLTGPPDRSPLSLNVRLELAGGRAEVNGTLDLTGAEAVYDLSGRLVDVSLEKILEPRVPPVLLTSAFSLRGRGVDPDRANAQITLAGRFTGWRTQPGDTVSLVARVASGALAVDRGVVRMGPLSLETQGQWRFVAPETGALTYRFAIADLQHLAPYIPVLPDSADGLVEGRGTIAGSLAQVRIEGELAGRDVMIAGWNSAAVEATHRIVLGDSLPQVRLNATATTITAPTREAYSKATLELEFAAPAFELAFQADRVGGGQLEVVADGHMPFTGARRLVLQRVRMDLGEAGRWALSAPSTIEWSAPGGAIDIRNFELRALEGEGRLSVDGRILPLAQVDVRVESAALPIADLQSLLGIRPRLSGLLWADAKLRGPGESPTLDVEFRVDGGSWQGVSFSRFEGNVDYQNQLLSGRATVTIDTAGSLTAEAALPMRVALAPSVDFDLLDFGAVSGSLTADSLAFAAVSAFFPEVREVAGVLSANAKLSGTVGSPIFEGSIHMVGGAMTVVPLDIRYTEITADIAFDQRSAQIRTLRARSDGWLDVSGRVDFPQLADPVANLTVVLDRFRLAGVEDREDAAAVGQIRISGPLSGPTLTGSVTFSDGDIPVPQMGKSPLDAKLAQLSQPLDLETPGGGGGGFLDAVRIDGLKVRAGEGLWFTMRNGRAQLSGELTINKANSDVVIVGTLAGERGTYILEAGPILRRFEIVKAEVRFLGSTPINPAIDITARRVIVDANGREMDIQVRVAGTLETPTLALASQGAAQIPESELLSFLLFGEPTLGLGGRAVPGEALIEETFLSGFAELATLELEDALGAPFDIFQIRLGGGQFGGLGSSVFVIGNEISDDLFLTVESGIGALFGPTENENVGNTWAVRLEWRIDPRTRLRLGYEPANRTRMIRGIGVALPINRRQQASLELRRRWTW